MEYRLDKDSLLTILQQWNSFLKKKVHLIACGGTAMTLLGVKASTKDVDFIVPNMAEYNYLIKTLKSLGYVPGSGSGWIRKEEGFIFDLFPGNKIHTTELLESPLTEGNNKKLYEYSKLYVGILNHYDLISSKLIRYTAVDVEDCEMLVRAKRDEIDIERLIGHYRELASYDIASDRITKHIDYFIDHLRMENLL